jgi:excisionase family DNA binding protein
MNDTDKLVEQVSQLVGHALRRVQLGSEIAPRLLDITDASRYLAMSDKSVRSLIQAGKLSYIQKIPGRSPYLLDRMELDQWVLKNKVRAGE